MKLVSIKKFKFDPHPSRENIICDREGVEFDVDSITADRLIKKELAKLVNHANKPYEKFKEKPDNKTSDFDCKDVDSKDEEKEESSEGQKKELSEDENLNLESLSKQDLLAFAQANGIDVDKRKKIESILEEVKESLNG